MTNEEYIKTNREADIRPLALKSAPEGVDVSWCLRQIEGYQTAKKKLPTWSKVENVWYPPKLSMEQCSSEATAIYKQTLAERLVKIPRDAAMMDLTGGFGVDFTYMAKNFGSAIYVEQQEVLCDAARHNFPLFGLEHAKVVQADSVSILYKTEKIDLIYIDPARRNDAGRKTVAISDCTPNLEMMQDSLLQKTDYVIVKLSPMLDITQALRSLKNVTEIHVVSVKGECKELLFVQQSKDWYDNSNAYDSITFYCVNLDTQDETFMGKREQQLADIATEMTYESIQGYMLFEPNASILKAGMQEEFARFYHLRKLHPQTNLFICSPEEWTELTDGQRDHIPARAFRIVDAGDFSKNSIRRMTGNIKKANITIRNFPTTVAELRKRMKLKEGGSDYFFATTLHDGKHAMVRCERQEIKNSDYGK